MIDAGVRYVSDGDDDFIGPATSRRAVSRLEGVAVKVLRLFPSISRVCAWTLTLALLSAQMLTATLALPPTALAASEPMTFSAATPAAGSTVGMSDPDISVKAADTADNHVTGATATIDGAPVTTSLNGGGTTIATASFPTFGLTQGAHAVSFTFTVEGGGTATDTWTFSVAPPSTHTLTYTAGAGGSIVGSSTQTVPYGTTSTQLEGFETIGEWNEGTPVADTANVLHGPTSLKLTATPDSPVWSYKNVSLNLSSAAPFRLYFYLDRDPKVAWPDVQLTFFTAGWSSRLTADILPDRMQQGWNCVSLSRNDFTSFGGASWSDTFKYLQVAVRSSSGTCCRRVARPRMGSFKSFGSKRG